jgi:hypothetical protein
VVARKQGLWIAAVNFLYEVVERIAADKRVTTDEMAELHKAIEKVLPVDSRKVAVQNRRQIEKAIEERKRELRRADCATEKQIGFLRGLGADIPEGLTKEKASEIIDALTKIRPLSQGQADFIERLGGIALSSLTYEKAGEFIEYLLERESKCARCGATDDRRHRRCSCGVFLPESTPICPSSWAPSLTVARHALADRPPLIVRMLNWIRTRH